MTDAQKTRFARRAGYSRTYIEVHYMYGTRTPTLGGLARLVKATEGKFTPSQLLAWFEVERVARSKKLARAARQR